MLSKHLAILLVISELTLLLGFTGCETKHPQTAGTEGRDRKVEEKAQQSVKEQTEPLAPELVGYRWVDDYPTLYLTFRQVAGATSYVIEMSTDALPKWRTLAVFVPSPLLPEQEATYSHRGVIRGLGIQPFYVRVRAKNDRGVGPA